MTLFEKEQAAREALDKASAAVQQWYTDHPLGTPQHKVCPDELFDALDKAREEHDAAYEAMLVEEEKGTSLVVQGVNARDWAENAANLHRNFLGAVHTAITQYLAGNTTNIAILIAVTHGIPNGLVPVTDKARMEFAAPLKRILSHVVPGLSYKRDKTKKVGLKIQTKAPVNPDKLGELREFAEASTNYKSDKVKAAFPAAERKVSEKSKDQTREAAEKQVSKIAAYVAAQGHDPVAFLEAMQASTPHVLAMLKAKRGEEVSH